jgi:hypothetical protein
MTSLLWTDKYEHKYKPYRPRLDRFDRLSIIGERADAKTKTLIKTATRRRSRAKFGTPLYAWEACMCPEPGRS